MKLDQLLDINRLSWLRDNRFVSMQSHPSLPLRIYNYTHLAQYDSKIWGDGTIDYCRGLIVDDENNIVARPFMKFWNLNTIFVPESQEANLPKTTPTITEKLDGCFHSTTKLNLWGGGTIRIGDLVRNRKKVVLVGVDSKGQIVPAKVLNWFDNGPKHNWYHLRVSNPVSSKSGCGSFGNTILVTGNHSIYVNGKYIPVCKAKKGDEVKHFENDINAVGRHIIESALLGDGSLSPVHQAYRFTDGHKEKSYAQYILSLLGTAGARKLRNRISGYGIKMHDANSLTLKSLIDLRKKWYPHDVKRVPQDLTWINDFSIAKWYMDDGYRPSSLKQKDRASFATNCFPKQDVERLAIKLSQMYDVNCTVFYSKGWNIRVNAGRDGEINRFWRAIAPHIHPKLRYKLPKEFRDVRFQKNSIGKLFARTTTYKILSIKPTKKDVRFYFGYKGFDVKTSTGNYFARGILVHNSLGVLWRYRSEYGIASRGSFTSPQAQWATNWLNEGINKQILSIPPDGSPYTWLFEIIYDANRIVLKYSREELVLLARIDKETGAECNHEMTREVGIRRGFSVARQIRNKNIHDLLQENKKNEEGYVVTYSRGDKVPPLKVKIKFEDYCHIHKIVTGMNPRTVWQLLKEGKYAGILTSNLPSHFINWLRSWEKKLTARVITLRKEVQEIYANRPFQLGLEGGRQYRKRCALYFEAQNRRDLKSAFFALLNGREDISDIIWDGIEPRGDDKSFRTDGE